MSFSKANALLLLAALSVVPALAVADVAQPIPNAQRLYATPSAGLPSAQIETLVAPIALYPDALLSQVLVASTYPLEVVEANEQAATLRNCMGPLTDPQRNIRTDLPTAALVSGDAHRLRQVIDNLATNARVHTDPNLSLIHISEPTRPY